MNLSTNKKFSFSLYSFGYGAGVVLLMLLACFLAQNTFAMEPIIGRDATFYESLILAKIKNGTSFYSTDFAKPPLFLILCSYIAGHWHTPVEATMIAVNSLCHAGAVLPVAFIARKWFHSRATALFCASLTAAHPLLLSLAADGIREPLFLLFMLFAAMTLVYCDQGKNLALVFLCGVLGALGFLCRFESILWGTFFAFYLLLQPILFSRKAIALFYGLLGFILTLAIATALSTEINLFLHRICHLFILEIRQWLC